LAVIVAEKKLAKEKKRLEKENKIKQERGELVE